MKPAFAFRILTVMLLCCAAGQGHAQTVPQAQFVLPGAADAGRVKTTPDITLPIETSSGRIAIPKTETANAPKGAEKIMFVLQKIKIGGVTVYQPQELLTTYQRLLGQKISLDNLWSIAAAITDKYRQNGYFLSRAFVPEQNVDDGSVTIKVVEGYIGQVELKDKLADRSIVKQLISHVTAERPLKTETLESFLLQLNDLPGVQFRGILSPIDKNAVGQADNAVKLTLEPNHELGHGTLAYDNYGSRFLGPSEFSASYTAAFLPLQQTTASLLATSTTNELKYGAVTHEVFILPHWSLLGSGSYTNSEPGFRLKPLEITSEAANFYGGVKYQALRQRDQNLALQLKLEGRNTNSDILGAALTRDRVRTLRTTAAYDKTDNWDGHTIGVVTLSHGLNILSSSKAGDPYLSRREATPDFSKAEFTLNRLQTIDQHWNVFLSAAGQVASGPLYSSEEFGFGGQDYGRAYDPSEITGDHGLNGAVELRYLINPYPNIVAQPYIFYDIGKVWNDDISQKAEESGSSAGFGVKVDSASGLSANFAAAFPLTLPENAPPFGNSRTARLRFGIAYSF